jgi:uroporphyrinogen decarboxylase
MRCRLIRRELAGRVPLIGFAGSPWTLATYMVEGGSSKDFARVKGLLYDHPNLLHQIAGSDRPGGDAYLNAQVAAGAQALMVFDTWGGILPARLPGVLFAYMARIVAGLTREAGKATDTGDPVHQGWRRLAGGHRRDRLRRGGCGLDRGFGRCPPAGGARVALQGNLDPPRCTPPPNASASR